MGFDYEIVYKKGVENRAADALSRVTSTELMSIAVSSVSTELMSQIQASWEINLKLKEIKNKLLQDGDFRSQFEWGDN